MNTQWGLTDAESNSVSWAAQSLQLGSGKAARAANNTALYNNVTPGAWANVRHANGIAIGQFGVSAAEMANTSGESRKVQATGWQLRRAYSGPIVAFHVAAGADGGAYFANGDTFVVTNGTVDAIGSVVVNSTAHMVAATVVDGGLFPNSSILEVNFNREQHLGKILETGGAATGYANTDYIVASNGTVDGRATLVTNSTGGFGNTEITLTRIGTFANDAVVGDVVLTVYAANGAASNGEGAVLEANLVASTGGAVTVTLGGRAGRVTYECLVASGHLSNGATDNTYLPTT